MKKIATITLVLVFLAGLMLSGCFLRGDPRKNCNHPQHGKYMTEKRNAGKGY